jgi:hypothetical protein
VPSCRALRCIHAIGGVFPDFTFREFWKHTAKPAFSKGLLRLLMKAHTNEKTSLVLSVWQQQNNSQLKWSDMKCSRRSVRTRATAIPELRFEDQRQTSFAGLVVIQKFFQLISFKIRLQACFRHLSQGKIFDGATIFMQLVVHLLLGFRELRDAAPYQDDPLVPRVLELRHLPDVATISRMLKDADQKSVDKLR